jgi:hypothetical protein
MPYLQVDLPAPASAEAKRSFAFRELGAENLVRLQDGELRAVLVVNAAQAFAIDFLASRRRIYAASARRDVPIRQDGAGMVTSGGKVTP